MSDVTEFSVAPPQEQGESVNFYVPIRNFPSLFPSDPGRGLSPFPEAASDSKGIGKAIGKEDIALP